MYIIDLLGGLYRSNINSSDEQVLFPNLGDLTGVALIAEGLNKVLECCLQWWPLRSLVTLTSITDSLLSQRTQPKTYVATFLAKFFGVLTYEPPLTRCCR